MKKCKEARECAFLNKLFANANFINCDKPDLQDDIHSIGVEVTTIISTRQKQLEDTYIKLIDIRFAGGKYKYLEGRLINTISSTGGILRGNRLTYPKEDNQIAKLIYAINVKSYKLNSGNYKIFESNFLYIELDCYDFDYEQIKKELCQIIATVKNYAIFYKKIIINNLCNVDSVIVVDIIKETLISVDIRCIKDNLL